MCTPLQSSTWRPVKQCFVVYDVAYTSGSVALTQKKEGGRFHDPHQASMIPIKLDQPVFLVQVRTGAQLTQDNQPAQTLWCKTL